MPGKPDKPHRMRIRVLDGKPREPNKLKGQLVPHVDVVDVKGKVEFVICAVKEAHLEQVRSKLGSAGVEELIGGDTTIAAVVTPQPTSAQAARQGGPPRRGGPQQRREPPGQQGRTERATNTEPLPGKPYGFVALPGNFESAPPVWHDGTSSRGRLSGEIRFELGTLTPLLVGWDRRQVNDAEEPWTISSRRVSRSECAGFVQSAARTVYPDAADSDVEERQKKQKKVEDDRKKYIERVQDHIVDVHIQNAGWCIDSKSVLCPLRAPWGIRPVIIPGDSLKGLLRHELGALLGAPMERVAERSYSYRPNALFPKDPNPRLIPRLARVPTDGVEIKALDQQHNVRVPKRLELLPTNLKYDKRREQSSNCYRFDDKKGAPYRGGQGAGVRLNSRRNLHSRLAANPSAPEDNVEVPSAVQEGYLATLRHLIDLDHGHFSERHPDIPKVIKGQDARDRILKAAKDEVFQPGDLIWVEWDTEEKCIVSLGWHYYYRWAYVDTVRSDADAPNGERRGLFPLADERAQDVDGAPKALSAVRRLFGYTGDNDGSRGIGKDDHAQLMGRVSVNAALEVVDDGDTDEKRFLPPTFLKELGMPRPSAVEFYLKQPYHPRSRPSDKATLVTYGDAAGYDTPGELAGRKFYLDREDAYSGEPWKDDSEANRANDRSTLALEASRPGRRFRFTLRFRDLDAAELAAILVALCPYQFREVLEGTDQHGYCSKLGYARPLGWGTVRIEAKALLLLDASDQPALRPESDLLAWVRRHHQATATQAKWLAAHRHKHPDAADYPRARDRDGNENIYTFHTTLRAEHTRARRCKNGKRP